jgi:RES domain-containing protein
MDVFRIVKDRKRATDLSGMGAFKAGGRWNSRGTVMLYTSENSSLAYLECLVHFDRRLMPPHLYITSITISDKAHVFELPASNYPRDWKTKGLIKNRELGDAFIKERKYLAMKLHSAVNELEYNYLLNPLYPGFNDLVKVKETKMIKVDERI